MTTNKEELMQRSIPFMRHGIPISVICGVLIGIFNDLDPSQKKVVLDWLPITIAVIVVCISGCFYSNYMSKKENPTLRDWGSILPSFFSAAAFAGTSYWCFKSGTPIPGFFIFGSVFFVSLTLIGIFQRIKLWRCQ